MVQIPDSLHWLFSVPDERCDGTYGIEVPSEEVTQGTITPGESYRIAVFAQPTTATSSTDRRYPPP